MLTKQRLPRVKYTTECTKLGVNKVVVFMLSLSETLSPD